MAVLIFVVVSRKRSPKNGKEGGMEIMESTRIESRLGIRKDTRIALKRLKAGGEPYDQLLRRFLLSGAPRSLDDLTEIERDWVLQN